MNIIGIIKNKEVNYFIISLPNSNCEKRPGNTEVALTCMEM